MPNVDIIIQGKNEATGAISAVTDALGGLGSMAAGAVAAGLAVAAAGFVALGAGMAFSVEQALGNEKIQASLAQAIKASGGAAGITAEAANKLAQGFVDLAGGSDDAILAIETIGIRAGTISSEQMPAFIQSTLDLGAVMGDTSAAATLLARAQEDPLAAMGKLQRAGIIFSEDLKDQIKTMVKAGDTAGATALLMGRVAEATGGAAAANAATLAGQWEILKGKIGEAAETIGTALLPTLHNLFDTIIAPAIPLIGEFGNAIAVVLGDIAGGDVGVAFDDLRESILSLGVKLGIPKEALEHFNQALFDVWQFVAGNMPLMQSTFETVFAAIQTVAGSLGAFVTGVLMPAIATIWGETNVELPTAQDTFESVMAAISAAVALVAGFVTGVLVPAMTMAVEWVVANWPAIQATVEAVFAAVQSTIATVMPIVQGIIEAVLGAMQAFWAAHGESITTIVSTLFSWLQTYVGTAIANTQIVIQTILGAIQVFWGTWGTTIVSVVTTMVTNFGIVIDAFAAAFRGDWTAFGEDIRQIFSNAWAAVVLIVTTAVNSIKAVDWGSVGTAIMQGIAAGINAASTFIVTAAKNAAQAAVDAVKGLLGIHSPSTVFASIGENMMQGLTIGINQSAHLPTYATTGALASTVNTTNHYAMPTGGGGLAADDLTVLMERMGATVARAVRDGIQQAR